MNKIKPEIIMENYKLQLKLILAYLRNLKLRELLYIFSAVITMPIIGYIIFGIMGSFICGFIIAVSIYLHIEKKIKNGEIEIIPKK